MLRSFSIGTITYVNKIIGTINWHMDLRNCFIPSPINSREECSVLPKLLNTHTGKVASGRKDFADIFRT
jgi:hypothetical protein